MDTSAPRRPTSRTPPAADRPGRPAPNNSRIAAAVAIAAGAALAAAPWAGPDPARYIAAVLWCAALSATDLRHRRLPNRLVGLGAVAAAMWALALPAGLPVALVGAGAAAALYLPGHLRGPIGAGDVKLAAVIGAICAPLGAPVWWLSALAPPLLAVAGAGLLAVADRAGKGRRRTLAYGPALCAGLLLALIAAGPVYR